MLKQIDRGHAIVHGRDIEWVMNHDPATGRTHRRYAEYRQLPDVAIVGAPNEIGPDGRVQKPRMRPGGIETVWQAGEHPRETFDRIDLPGGFFDPRPVSPVHDEADRARAAGFEAWAAQLTAMAKLKPRPEIDEALFNPGRSYLCRTGFPFGESAAREMVQRHARGDFGAFGVIDAEPLTEEQLAVPVMFDRLIRNRVAIARGWGLVHSRYAFETGDGEMRRTEDIDVVTLIGDGVPLTKVWCPRTSTIGI